MTLHLQYLAALERSRDIQRCVGACQLRSYTAYFLRQRWIIEESYQTHILVPVLNADEEIEVHVDQDTHTFSYVSPGCRSRKIVRPLSDIMLYVFNIDAWLDSLADIFEIDPMRRARQRTIIDAHLWHLGDIRIARSHQFAPLYVARRFINTSPDWQRALCDPIRPSKGIVLTASETNSDVDINLPNGHQLRFLDCLLNDSPDGTACNQELLTRLLQGAPTNGVRLDEYFDEKTGRLKLHHIDEPITFIGVQKKIIKIFWNARNAPPLTWAEVKHQSGSAAKSIDRAFGKNDDWMTWIERVDYGKFKIRV